MLLSLLDIHYIQKEALPDIIQDDPMDVDEQVSITPLRFGNRITPSHKLLLKSDTIVSGIYKL